ncbi:MAG: prepilin-type N-terminal cleavage/methylation domain-containing protein, partial [Glaciecola sp.]
MHSLRRNNLEHSKPNNHQGFTLIELLVVVAIISIIAAIGFVAYSGYVEAAKKKTAENAMM